MNKYLCFFSYELMYYFFSYNSFTFSIVCKY